MCHKNRRLGAGATKPFNCFDVSFFVFRALELFGAHGAVEEFDDVHDFLLAVDALDAGTELEQAARVGGDDDFGFYGGDVLHFVVEQLERGFGLRDVVDTGRSAANVGVREFDELEAGDLFQEIAWGVADFLSVEQVA